MEPFIENYIRAFYLDKEALPEWLRQHQVNIHIIFMLLWFIFFVAFVYGRANSKIIASCTAQKITKYPK